MRAVRPLATLAPAAAVLLAGAVAGCAPIDRAGRGALEVVTPYKVEVVQGNVVSREQVEQLRIGMPRPQVREILGTPLLTDVFHAQRWDYVFTIDRQPLAPQRRRMTVFFADDLLARVDGDAMPKEQDFVASLRNHGLPPRDVPLQASEEALRALEP